MNAIDFFWTLLNLRLRLFVLETSAHASWYIINSLVNRVKQFFNADNGIAFFFVCLEDSFTPPTSAPRLLLCLFSPVPALMHIQPPPPPLWILRAPPSLLVGNMCCGYIDSPVIECLVSKPTTLRSSTQPYTFSRERPTGAIHKVSDAVPVLRPLPLPPPEPHGCSKCEAATHCTKSGLLL